MLTKTEMAEYLADNVQGVGSRAYEIKRYMKMTKPMLEALLDSATAPTPAAREEAQEGFHQAQTARYVAEMQRRNRIGRR